MCDARAGRAPLLEQRSDRRAWQLFWVLSRLRLPGSLASAFEELRAYLFCKPVLDRREENDHCRQQQTGGGSVNGMSVNMNHLAGASGVDGVTFEQIDA